MTAPQLALDVHHEPTVDVPLERPDGSWMARYLPCRDEDPEAFFGITEQSIEYAKSVCAGCVSRASCLADAVTTEQAGPLFGVRGGLSGLEREGLVSRYRRARAWGPLEPVRASLLESLSPEARAAAVEAGASGTVADHWPARVRSELVRTGAWAETIPTVKNRGGGGIRANQRGRAELARYRREQAGTRVTEQPS